MSANEFKVFAGKIVKQLKDLESSAWNVLMECRGGPAQNSDVTYIFYGSRMLFYKICLFIEFKQLPDYLASSKESSNPR